MTEKQNKLNEEMFILADYTKGNVFCNDISCTIFNAGFKPYRAKIPPGLYFFELWGASGGDREGPPNYIANGGKGGYTAGYAIHTKKEIYLFIGTQGENETNIGKGGWNGGGTSCFVNNEVNKGYIHGGAGGGGSTDISLELGNNYEENRSINSLKSRFIVAAGGGGAWSSNYAQSYFHFTNDGGYGGGEEGGGSGYGYTKICNANECSPTLITQENHKSSIKGATQTSSGDNSLDFSKCSQKGGFGFGGD